MESLMSTEQRAFFELVRAGLWGTAADPAAFDEHTDWKELYRRGKNQTLLGVMLDGIQTLPDELRPGRGLYLQWCASVLQIEENNKKLNEEILNLFTLLRTHGVEPVLLKGQGAARNYLEPLHRQCGDIDIYIGNTHFEQVNKLLQQDGEEAHEANFKHSAYHWHGIVVENHRVLTQMKAPFANRRMKRNIESWHGTEKEVRYNLDGLAIAVPPVEFDAVYLLQHSVVHLLEVGIGLRQVCDWACLLHNNRGTINKQNVAHELSALGLDKAARIFGALSVNYLGLDERDLPLAYDAEDRADGDWLLNEIWKSGNFGAYDPDKAARPKGYWRGKWYTFTTFSGRRHNFKRVVPSEAFWIPFRTISNFFLSQLYLHLRK